MDWNDVPKTLGLCTVADCPVSSTCLRHLAAPLLPEEPLQWFFVNPALTRQRSAEGCPLYADAAPKRIAYGFIGALNTIALGQVPLVREAIMREFDIRRSTFFQMRRGFRSLNPDEQERIAAILVRFGAKEPVEFDDYREEIYWPL